MTKTQLNKLRDAVREVVLELYAQKHGTTHWLVDTVTERYPELVQEASRQLIRDSIGKMARQIMKSDSRSDKSTQMVLPMVIADLRLPAAISVPAADSDDENDALWTPLHEATCDDLKRHITMLADSIAANRRRLRSLRQLYQYISERTPTAANDTTIGDILKTLAEQEQRAA